MVKNSAPEFRDSSIAKLHFNMAIIYEHFHSKMAFSDENDQFGRHDGPLTFIFDEIHYLDPNKAQKS